MKKQGAALAVTAFLKRLGLAVEQGTGSTSVQTVRGVAQQVGTATWYAVNHNINQGISSGRVNEIRRKLNVAMLDELAQWLSASVLVKRVSANEVPARAVTKLQPHSLYLQQAAVKRGKWELVASDLASKRVEVSPERLLPHPEWDEVLKPVNGESSKTKNNTSSLSA